MAMAGAFDELWSRPNAARTMAGFLAGTEVEALPDETARLIRGHSLSPY